MKEYNPRFLVKMSDLSVVPMATESMLHMVDKKDRFIRYKSVPFPGTNTVISFAMDYGSHVGPSREVVHGTAIVGDFLHFDEVIT